MKLFWTTLFIFTPSVFAATSEFPLKDGDRLKVAVSEISIQITGGKSSSLRVYAQDSGADTLLFERKEGMIEIRDRELSDRKEFGKVKLPKRVIEITGASLPVEVHSFDGQVTVAKWSDDVHIQLQKGKINIKDIQGNLDLHSQKGEIQIQNVSGKVQLDTHQASVVIRDMNGDLDLVNFAGDTVLDKSKGNFDLNFNQGTTKVLTSSGSLEFETGKGVLTSQGFQGRIEGQSQEGTINVVMASEQDLSVKTQTGKVVVTPSANSGASLNLTTVEGDIYVPSYLKVNRDGASKFLRGRLRGDVQKGHLSIRSQEGSILIK